MSEPAPWLPRALVCSLIFSLAIGCASQRAVQLRPGYSERGLASWYGKPFHGRPTASGVIYDMNGLTAAHRDLPLGTWIEVRHLENGRKVEVEVNDRGPFVRGRILDLSRQAARQLGMEHEGVAKVEIRVLRVGQGTGRVRGPYNVQVGAFREQQNAADLQRRLAHLGNVQVVRVGEFFRVRVGPFADRKAAEKMHRKLEKAGHSGFVLGST